MQGKLLFHCLKDKKLSMTVTFSLSFLVLSLSIFSVSFSFFPFLSFGAQWMKEGPHSCVCEILRWRDMAGQGKKATMYNYQCFPSVSLDGAVCVCMCVWWFFSLCCVPVDPISEETPVLQFWEVLLCSLIFSFFIFSALSFWLHIC